jgi:hypothetical protein
MGYFRANRIPASRPTLTPRATTIPKTTTKRRQEAEDLEVIEERTIKKPTVTAVKNPEQEQAETFFQVSVTSHAKYNKFPVALCNKLQAACQTTFYEHIFSLEAGTVLEYRQQYSVVTGTRVRTLSMVFETEVAVPNIFDLGVANAALLKNFVRSCPARYGKLEKERCIELKTQKGIRNEGFIELYAVRHGELGWGFDTDGCLSLYAIAVADGKPKEKVWYVKAGSIKLKGES